MKMFVFSALLGSTLDLWCCQSSWPLHRCSSRTRLFCLDPEVHHNGGAAVAVPLQGRQHPCRCAETASHGLTFQRPLRFSCCSTLTKWLMLVVHVRQVPWYSLRGDGRYPTVAASMLDTVVHMSVVVQRQVPLLVETVQNLWEFRSWHCLLDRLMTCPLACRFFRAVYTGTRPGLSPAIRAEKGWRGHRELAPRCSATQLVACRNAPGQTRRSLSHVHHQHHPSGPHFFFFRPRSPTLQASPPFEPLRASHLSSPHHSDPHPYSAIVRL